MRLRVLYLVTAIALTTSACFASDCERNGHPVKTPRGRLIQFYCRSDKGAGMQFVEVDGSRILQDRVLSQEEHNSSRSIWLFSGGGDVSTGCPNHLYLLDLSTNPITVLAFGVKTACNEFEWASWGDRRSVIALKHNVRFIYENGQLKPPSAGPKLFNSIEPPHSSIGGGMSEDSAKPFVEIVPPPAPESP